MIRNAGAVVRFVLVAGLAVVVIVALNVAAVALGIRVAGYFGWL